jgi:hypothetical protein
MIVIGTASMTLTALRHSVKRSTLILLRVRDPEPEIAKATWLKQQPMILKLANDRNRNTIEQASFESARPAGRGGVRQTRLGPR